jgi:hypothetical protein
VEVVVMAFLAIILSLVTQAAALPTLQIILTLEVLLESVEVAEAVEVADMLAA